MSHPAIRIENLGKRYVVDHESRGRRGSYKTLRESLSEAAAWPLRRLLGEVGTTHEEFWALKDVSFEVQPGEVVGIIGRNGAGKSTLLKILSQITKPTKGRVELHGRVGSLLEVGTGFHPELTGRENIYLNGSILGMRKSEIDRKFDEIVAFAETEQFLDLPVKRYSSGMQVRLAFAVAAHLELETMFIDEVLAVGDHQFQKKCFGKMGDLARSGRTVVLVSHDMSSVVNLCPTVIVLERGSVGYRGATDKGIERFMDSANSQHSGKVDLTSHPHRQPGCTPIIRSAQFVNARGRTTNQHFTGDPLRIELEIDAGLAPGDLDFDICVNDSIGTRLFTISTTLGNAHPLHVATHNRIAATIDSLALAPGQYCLSLKARVPHKPPVDAVYKVAWFDVLAGDFYGNGQTPQICDGRFLVRSTWNHM